jgi:riboflavin kinase/FMN adenylyltransferase
LAHRLRLIAEAGLDVCVVISFNKVFSRMPADKFIRDILVEKIGVSLVCVGENFRFGNSAQGDIRLLKRLGGAYHYRVKDFKILKINKRSISSTFIRALIKKGKIEEARRLLGRPVSILGTVIKGSALGRIIGFPTANINPHHEVMPPEGIYAVEVNLGRKRRKGVCYIGNRPTLNLKKRSIHIEVYLFNFDRNIYGEYLEIEFIKRIRKDKKFPSLALLAKQIKKDAYLAQKILN